MGASLAVPESRRRCFLRRQRKNIKAAPARTRRIPTTMPAMANPGRAPTVVGGEREGGLVLDGPRTPVVTEVAVTVESVVLGPKSTGGVRDSQHSLRGITNVVVVGAGRKALTTRVVWDRSEQDVDSGLRRDATCILDAP